MDSDSSAYTNFISLVATAVVSVAGCCVPEGAADTVGELVAGGAGAKPATGKRGRGGAPGGRPGGGPGGNTPGRGGACPGGMGGMPCWYGCGCWGW